jgi:AcrR family transcriptional regulator
LHFKGKDELVSALMQQVGPDVAAYYSGLDTVLAEGSRADFREWLRDTMRWFAEHHTLVRVLDQLRGYQPHPTSGLISRSFTDHMPRYLARWPAEKQDEAKLRVWLAVTLLTRIEVIRPPGVTTDSVDDAAVEILTDLWVAALKMR